MPNDSVQFFNGQLDDIAIYNRALSASEVQQLYLGNSTLNASVTSSVPGKINYQGMAMGTQRKPIKNGSIGLRFSVIDSSPVGAVLFTETLQVTTDSFGIFATQIGGGTITFGKFENIPWSNGKNKFLKVEMDILGGSNYQTMGTTQLVSVPYALHAGSAEVAKSAMTIQDNLGNNYKVSLVNGQPTLVPAPGSTSNPGSFACGQSVTYAGESYPTVQIGNQCWFQKNLNVGSMVLGANDQTNNSVLEKYCYNNDTANCAIYGGLYQWAEAVQYQNGASNTTSPSPAFSGNVKGVCPNGWHIPNDVEWSTFENYLGGSSVAGRKIKSVTNLWPAPNYADNSSGFSALPSGYRYYQRTFLGLNGSTHFWSSNQASNSRANYKDLFSDSIFPPMVNNLKTFGLVVRCLMDSICSTTTSSAGPDQLSLTGTTATLAANTPAAGETGTWTITTGSGASLSNANSPTATLTKSTDSAYTLVWTITGPCGSSRDTVNLRFPAPVGTACGQAVTYAGESYPTVQIGTQCWFQKNLNVGTMILGANDQTNNSVLEKYCYNNDTANCAIYGGLYQWAEAVQYQNGASNTASPNPAFSGNVKGMCPTGWHVPSDGEWCTLTVFLDATVNCSVIGWTGTNAGGKMKSTSSLWNSPNTGATNSSGFTALPGGYLSPNRLFEGNRVNTPFWSSTENSNTTARHRDTDCFSSNLFRVNDPKIDGFSIRCIKN